MGCVARCVHRRHCDIKQTPWHCGTTAARAACRPCRPSGAAPSLFQVVVWTAGIRVYAQSVISQIDRTRVIKHCVYRHTRWYDQEQYTKDLKLLGRDLDSTIIIENTPDCVVRNVANGIIVPDYAAHNPRDKILAALQKLLHRLIEYKKTPGSSVQRFVQECPELILRPTMMGAMGETSGSCYCIRFQPDA